MTDSSHKGVSISRTEHVVQTVSASTEVNVSKNRKISLAVGDADFDDSIRRASGSSGPSSRRPSYPRRMSHRHSVAGHSILREENAHTISNLAAGIHLIKGHVAAGILALPNAFNNAGYVVGLLMMTVVCVFCVFGMHELIWCAHALSHKTGKPAFTFPDVAQYVFLTHKSRKMQKIAPYARGFVNLTLIVSQLGFCSVYLVFLNENLGKFIDLYTEPLDSVAMMACITAAMLIFCSITNLKYLAPLSLLSNITLFSGLGIIYYTYFKGGLPPLTDRDPVAGLATLPLAFGTIIYAFEGIGVVLPLENQMKNPKSMIGWFGVLNISLAIVTLLYMFTAFVGYWKYGGLDEFPGSISLVLPETEWTAKAVMILISIGVFFTYPLIFYVPIELILPPLQVYFPGKYDTIVELVLRYALVLLTFGAAAVVPKLDLFISLIGASCCSILALILPPIFYLVMFGKDLSGCKGIFLLTFNIIFLALGLLGMVIGTFFSLQDIIKAF